MVNLVKIILLSLLFTSTAMASGGHDRRHGYDHHKHHYRHNRPYYPPVERVYYREEVRYYPAPVVRYQAVPQYQPVPRYDYYDRRTTSGLVGGALGSVVGYEIGRGDPIAAGIGAAAGSLLGNEIRR
jgi:uncharacterized protein YcfJ